MARGHRVRSVSQYMHMLKEVVGKWPTEEHILNRFGRRIVVLVWHYKQLSVQQIAEGAGLWQLEVTDKTQFLALYDKARDLDLESYMIRRWRPVGGVRWNYNPTTNTELANMITVWVPNE